MKFLKIVARVIEEQRGSYRLLSDDAEYRAVVGGRLRRRRERCGYGLLSDDAEQLSKLADQLRSGAPGRRAELHSELPSERPVVGDWVRAVAQTPDTGRAVIHEVLPRRSRIARRAAGNATEEQLLAANVDTVFIVSSLNLDLSSRRLDRYVTLARNGGVMPVILLNKADLCVDAVGAVTQLVASMPRVAVHAMSAALGQGLEALALYLSPGQTCVLLGSSGVGKSTIVNRLLGEETQQVSPVRQRDDRGRHTTTHRQLLRLPGGAFLIDTPGLREIQLWNDEDDGLEHAFGDIAALAAACRFTDCQHETEPGCAVKAAVAARTLDPGRLASHTKLRREAAFLERKQQKRAQADHKKSNRAANLVKRTRRVR